MNHKVELITNISYLRFFMIVQSITLKPKKNKTNKVVQFIQPEEAENFPCNHGNRLSLLRDMKVSLALGFSNKSKAKK